MSPLAYGATAYFKSVNNNNNNNINAKTMFILAKSRLAPLKERLLTIPELKFQAAVIAERIKRQSSIRLLSMQK